MLYSKFLCYVSGSSSRIAQCSTSPALLPWRRPVEANHLVALGCSFCSGLFVAHFCWSLERENARNYETKTSSSYFDVEWFPCSLVRGRISAPVDRRLHDRKQPHTPHKSFRTPIICSIMSQCKLSKSCQHFLNLLVKKTQIWEVNVLSPRMPFYGTLSLFRTSFAGCYAFPCVSLGCDVSTCKPYDEPVGNALFRKPMHIAFTEWFVPSPMNSSFHCSKTAKLREPPVQTGHLSPSLLDSSVTVTFGLQLLFSCMIFLWNVFLSASASRSVLLLLLSVVHACAAGPNLPGRQKSDTACCHWQREVHVIRRPLPRTTGRTSEGGRTSECLHASSWSKCMRDVTEHVGTRYVRFLRFVAGYARFWSFYSAGRSWVAVRSPLSASISSRSWNSERSKVEEKTLWRQDNLSSAECFFVWALAQMKVPWVVFPHASTFWAIL